MCSIVIAKKINVDKFFFLKKQLIFATIAVILMISISFLSLARVKVIGLFGLIATIFLLIAVLFFGSHTKGATRWLSIAGFTLQPSEFAKTFFVIVHGYILQKFYLIEQTCLLFRILEKILVLK